MKKWITVLGLLGCLMSTQGFAQTEKMKIAFYLQETNGYINTDCLDYIKAMGYTHVQYGMFQDAIELPNVFKKSPATGTAYKWIYNNSNYSGGVIAQYFIQAKAEIEARGMKIIPQIPTLTHAAIMFKLDPSISEFNSSAAYVTYNGASVENHVANVGDYTITNLLTNPQPVNPNIHMDEIICEYLKIIKTCWGATPLGGSRPEYIHIGHDEVGVGCTSLIKASGSSQYGPSASELVAREIAFRYDLIQKTFNTSTSPIKIMLYGDSFLPGDIGEFFKLCGNTSTGEGGVLHELLSNTVVAQNTIVMPWGYSFYDGVPRANQPCDQSIKFDKVKQAKYLNTLGYKWIFASGEDGLFLPYLGETPGWVSLVKNCTFDWLRTSLHENYGKNVIGYACNHYDAFTTTSTSTGYTVGFSDALLMYLLKYPYLAKTYGAETICNYNPDVFSGLNERLVRSDKQFIYGKNYTIGLGLRSFTDGNMDNGNKVSGKWTTPYTSYQLEGMGKGGYFIQHWNGSYAFAQLQDFDIRVCSNQFVNGSKDAGLLISQDFPSIINQPVNAYFSYDNTVHYITIQGRTLSTSSRTGNYPDEKYLRITKFGNKVSFFSSPDGSNYFFRTDIGDFTGKVFVGMAMTPNNATNSCSVGFSNIFINPNGPEYPLDMNICKLGTANLNSFSSNATLNQITLSGNSNIAAKADNVVFVNKSIEGGFQADVKIENISNRAGIMVRQTLTPGSPMVYLFKNQVNNTVQILYRTTENSDYISTPVPGIQASTPIYLRLTRYGSIVRGSYSVDGKTFIAIAKVPFKSGSACIGMCTDGSATASATFTNYIVKGYDPMTPILNLLLND